MSSPTSNSIRARNPQCPSNSCRRCRTRNPSRRPQIVSDVAASHETLAPLLDVVAADELFSNLTLPLCFCKIRDNISMACFLLGAILSTVSNCLPYYHEYSIIPKSELFIVAKILDLLHINKPNLLQSSSFLGVTVDDLRRQLDTSNDEKVELERQLKASNEAGDELTRQLETSNDEKVELQLQLKASNDARDELTRQLETSNDEKVDLERHLKASSDARIDLTRQLMTTNGELVARRIRCDELNRCL